MNNSTNKRHTHQSVVTGKTMAEATSDVKEEFLVAELIEDSSSSSRKELNLSMLSTIAISIVFLILAMLLTPPDIFSQLFLALPMWLLFELGLVLSKDKD